MWSSLTVGKFQQLFDIMQGKNFDHEMDRSIHLLSCLYGHSVEHYEAMTIQALKEEVKKISFLHSEEAPVVSVKDTLQAGRRTYKPLFDFTQLCAGQFIDVISIAKTPEEHILNLNRTLAAICLPVEKRRFRKQRVLKYGEIPFEDVADDMLEANLLEVQAIASFFMQLWTDFLKSMPAFLAEKMKTMEPEERMKWKAVLEAVGAGS